MITTHSRVGVTWIDAESPTDQEIGELVRKHELHPLVGEELKSSSSLAKIDFYKYYILIVLTIPVRIRRNGGYEIVDREIDFVVGKDFLITSRYDTLEQVEYFAKVFEANSILNKDEKLEHAGHLFYYLVRRIYAGMLQDLDNIKDALVAAESQIFKGEERSMVEALSNLSRELIDFKQTARIHSDIWKELTEHADNALFGKDFPAYVEEIRNEFGRIHETIVNARELLTDLRETNDSLLNTKQNEIIKVLTLIALIFNPLTFIASVFTIPAAYVPLVGKPYGWTIIVIIMVVLVIFTWGIFKKKRWV